MTIRNNGKFRNNSKSQSGFIMAWVLALCAFGGMSLMYLISMLMPTYERAGLESRISTTRAGAEAGLDWAISSLNNYYSGSSTTNIDDPSNDGQAAVTNVPSSVTTFTAANGAPITVQVKVSVNNVSCPNTSSVYNPAWDTSNPKYSFAGNSPNNNGWRVLISTAKYAGLTRTIRCILQPNFNGGAGGGGTPYFKFALYSIGTGTYSGGVTADGYNSSSGAYGGANVNLYQGNIASGTSLSFSGGMTVHGSVIAYQPTNPGTTEAKFSSISYSGSLQVNNQVVAWGTAGSTNQYNTFVQTPGAVPGSSDNVFSEGYFNSSTAPTYTPSPNRTTAGTDPISGVAYNTPFVADNTSASGIYPTTNASAQSLAGSVPNGPAMPAALTIPSNESVAPVQIASSTGNNSSYGVTTLAAPAAGTVGNLAQALQGTNSYSFSTVGSGLTLHIPPGDYTVPTWTITGGANVIIDAPPSGGSGVARIFVQGSSSSTAISLGGGGITNKTGIPSNLQLWYNGSKNVSLAGGAKFTGTIYAPNATISNSGGATLYGAVVGNIVNMSGGTVVHYDTALSTGGANSALLYGATPQTLSNVMSISWQEELGQ